jgi:thiamine kinase-like enzyme
MAELGAIVQRLETLLGPADGAPVSLEGGITNRNYRVSFAGRDCVVRLPGKHTALLGISRDAERVASDSAARLGIAPALAAGEPDCLVTEYVPGHPLTSAEVCAKPEPIARAIRRFHDRAAPLPVAFWVPALLESYARVVAEKGGSLPPEYSSAQEMANRIADVLPLDEPVPCHNDLLCANLLGTVGGDVLLVDWEYAGMGHRMFDLGNLAVNNELDDAAERRLLEAYFDEPPGEPRTAALRLMRIMSDAREAAWGVVQAVVSELEFDFNSYAEKHFGRLTQAAADPRLEEWLDAAAA